MKLFFEVIKKNIPLVVFLVLYFIFAIIYTQERMVFADNALHIFWTSNINSPGVMAGRWPIAIIRLPLWLASILQSPMPILLNLYNITHAFFISALLIIGISKTKNLLPIILYTSVAAHTFFWCVSELIPACLLAIVLVKAKKISVWVFALVLLLIFIHPQSILLIGFVACLQILDKNYTPSIVMGLFALTIYTIKSLLLPNWYDISKTQQLSDHWNTHGFEFLTSPLATQIKNVVLFEWPLLSLMVIVTSLSLLLKRKFLLMAVYTFFIGITLGLFILTNLKEVALSYLEASLYLVAFYTIAIWHHMDVKKDWIQKVAYFSIIYFMCKVIYISTTYTERYNAVANLVNESKNDRCIISKNNLPSPYNIYEWGLPFESAIISSLNQDQPLKTIVLDESLPNYKSAQDTAKIILNGMGGYFQVSNSNYIYQGLSSSPYVECE